MESVNLAMIGLGRMGSIHLDNLAGHVGGVRVVAVCDSDTAARERAAERYGVPAFGTVEDVLCQPNIDGVVIVTTTRTHGDVIAAAARAGKHIFAEKPVCLTLAETDVVLQQVLDAGVIFQIGFQRRWDPDYLEARRQIAAGAIGHPVLFRGIGRDPAPAALSYHTPANSGGLFLDAAIHDYDVARFLMGREVVAVSAHGANLVHHELGSVGDVDTGTTVLTFAGGGMGVTEWNRFAVYGCDTYAEVQGPEGAVRIGTPPETGVELLTRAGAARAYPPGIAERFGPAYRAELAAFVRAVRGGQPAAPGIEDARAALNIALCARASFQSGTAVQVPALTPLRPGG